MKRKPAKQKLATSKKAPKKALKKLAMKRKPAKQKLATSKKAPKKAKKTLGTRRTRAVSTPTPEESQMLDTTVPSARIRGGSGGQSGDLQGLSAIERADSESVGELLEEGNAFEAGVVMGVEDADDDDPEAVQTHQVPEDDVPGEYLDND